jgi:hypothetical protein
MIEVSKMKFRKYVAVCALALAAAGLVPAAHAESIELATGMMKGMGKLSSDTDLYVTTAGKLSVQVTDLGVPLTIMDRLASLSFSITDSSGIFASRGSEGSLVLDITNPGLYGLHIIGLPDHSQFPYTLGVVSWNVSFEPLAPVPLPAGVWFLIAGAAWAIGLQRKRAKLAADESGGLLAWCPRLAPAH